MTLDQAWDLLHQRRARRSAGLDPEGAAVGCRHRRGVRGLMADTCTHLDQIQLDITPSGDGCKECLEMGDIWVHLRLCMVCGTWAAATARRTSTPRSIITPRSTRSSSPSSRARTGSGATRTSSCSSWTRTVLNNPISQQSPRPGRRSPGAEPGLFESSATESAEPGLRFAMNPAASPSPSFRDIRRGPPNAQVRDRLSFLGPWYLHGACRRRPEARQQASRQNPLSARIPRTQTTALQAFAKSTERGLPMPCVAKGRTSGAPEDAAHGECLRHPPCPTLPTKMSSCPQGQDIL